MKILITGSEGYIGSHLKRALPESDCVDRKLGSDILDGIKGKYDLIYHLAAQTDIQSSDTLQMLRDNILGTIEVAKDGCPVIFVSSAAVYGKSIYGYTKAIGEEILKGHTILRLGNVWGGIGGHGVWDKLANGGKINGNGKNTRDYVHIDDVIRALLSAPKWPKGIYEISTGRQTSVNKVAELLGVKKVYAPSVEEEKSVNLDNSKALKMGWKPIIKL